MGSSIYKVTESGQSCGKSNSGSVKGDNEDLWVCVEGMCQVDVIGNKALDITPASIYVIVRLWRTSQKVCTAI